MKEIPTTSPYNLRGWTDGPKILFDCTKSYEQKDFRVPIEIIYCDETDLENQLEFCSPAATLYFVADITAVEYLATRFDNSMYIMLAWP